MQVIFKDASLQKSFEEKGYVIVRAAISTEKIDAINAFYQQKATNPEDIPLRLGMVDATIPFQNEQFQKDLISTYQTNIGTTIENLLVDYSIMYSSMSFVNKRPNQEILSIHRHPFYIDIRKSTALVVWIPMTDVNEKNGALQILPNTFSDYLFDFDTNNLKERSEVATMSKGDVLILNNILQHWSDTNYTDKDRLSLGFPVLPKNAPLVSHTVEETDGKIIVNMYEYDDAHTYFVSTENLKQDKLLESFVYKNAKPLATSPVQKSVPVNEQNLTLNKTEEGLRTGQIYKLWRKLPANLRKRFFDITRG